MTLNHELRDAFLQISLKEYTVGQTQVLPGGTVSMVQTNQTEPLLMLLLEL